jgi:peptide/nickel transport system permease protein
VITEQVFSWPGVGRLAVESINARDFPVVQAVTIVAATGIVLASLLVDFVQIATDPRVRDNL